MFWIFDASGSSWSGLLFTSVPQQFLYRQESNCLSPASFSRVCLVSIHFLSPFTSVLTDCHHSPVVMKLHLAKHINSAESFSIVPLVWHSSLMVTPRLTRFVSPSPTHAPHPSPFSRKFDGILRVSRVRSTTGLLSAL